MSGFLVMFLIICHSVLSIVVILLGVDGMRTMPLNNDMTNKEFGRIIARMSECLRRSIYIFEALLHILTLFYIPPYMKMCLLLFLLFITAYTINITMLKPDTCHMNDSQERRSLYRCRETHSLRTWIIYIIGLLILGCWSGVVLVVVVFHAVAELVISIMKHRIHPENGWKLLKNILNRNNLRKSKRPCFK